MRPLPKSAPSGKKNSGGAAPNTAISTTAGGEDADQLAIFGDGEHEHDEEEGDVDYTQNYYASEEDSDVGDIGGKFESVIVRKKAMSGHADFGLLLLFAYGGQNQGPEKKNSLQKHLFVFPF